MRTRGRGPRNNNPPDPPTTKKTDKSQRIKWKDVGHTTRKENITQRIIKSASSIDGPLGPISFFFFSLSFSIQSTTSTVGHGPSIEDHQKERQFDYSCLWRRTPSAVPLVDKPVERQIRKIRKKTQQTGK
jgi:hypothetical protein